MCEREEGLVGMTYKEWKEKIREEMVRRHGFAMRETQDQG